MFVRMKAYPDVIGVAVRVNPPAAGHDHMPAHMNTVGGTHMPNLQRKIGTESLRSQGIT